MVNSITQVLSPQFSKIETKKEIVSLLKKGLLYMGIPTAVFIAAILTPTNIYTLVFTSKFVKSASITRMLSGAFLLYAVTAVPALFFLYTIKKPLHLLWMNTIFLITVAIGCFLFIQKYGVFGPPLAFIIAFAMVFLYILIFFPMEFRKLK